MGSFSQSIANNPTNQSGGGKFDQFQNKVTTPTSSGQQQYGQPIQTADMPMGAPTEEPPVGAPMPQSNTNAPAPLSSFAQPMLQDQQGNVGLLQTDDMRSTGFGGNNSYPNTIGQGNNQSQQPHGFMGKGKGA